MPGRSPLSERARLYARRFLVCLASSAACISSGAAAAQVVQHVFPGVISAGQSVTLPVTVTPSSSGTLAAVRVLTNGVSGKDFQLADGGTCTALPVVAGVPCTVSVTFKPTAPGHRVGAVILVQGSPMAVLGQQPIDGNASGPLAVIQPGHVNRVAGNGLQTQYVDGEEGTNNTGGIAIYAHIFLPRGIVSTPAGDFFISDTFNNRIRHVSGTASTALINTYAGNGIPGATGDGGLATSANVNQPAQLALDGAGNLYIADTGNDTIRRVDAVTGIITTVAGGGNTPFTVDGVAATSAALNTPYGIAFDADGNLFIADTGDNVVRKVDAVTGLIRTVAGTGVAGSNGDGGPALTAQLSQPYGLAFGPDGLLYIADEANHAVRRLNSDGTVTTVAGVLAYPTPDLAGDGSIAKQAHLNFPTSIALDAAGNLYIADSQNNRIRRVKAVNGSLDNAIIDSVVGPLNANIAANTNSQLNADSVILSTPYAITLDGANNLFISDAFNKQILEVHGDQSRLRFADMKVGKLSAATQLLNIENDGSTASTLASMGFNYNQSALDQTKTTCTSSTALAVGARCVLGVQFAPTNISIQNPDGTYKDPTGSLTILSNATNSPATVSMDATVLSVEPTQIEFLPAPQATVAQGANITFSVFVSETSGNGLPTGTVTFYDGTTAISGALRLTSGFGYLITNTLPLGPHSITAQYSGDDNHASSVTAPATVTVLQTTNTTIQSNLNPAAVLQTVTFNAAVTGATAVTSGTMQFYDGGTLLGSSSIGPDGKASYSVSDLVGGTHSVTAKFTGDTSNAASTSAPLQQVITKAPVTVLVGASPASITVGQATVLTANVTSSGPAPTGTVTFLSGSTSVGTGSLNSNGSASVPVSNLVPTSASITAVYSGDSYNSNATSPATVVTVNKLQTTTTLSSNGSPANAGSTITLTATVAMSPGQTSVGPLTGNVTFYDGSATLGTVDLNNGSASLPTTGLVVGTHQLTARYNANTNYDVSTSAPLAQQVIITSSTTGLTVSSSNIIAGNSVTLTATVTASGTVKPTGTVTFTDNGNPLSPVGLSATTGLASLPISTLTPGSHAIVATYNGDTNYTGSASAASTVSVRQGNVTLALTAAPTRSTYNTPVVATITLTGDGVLPANPAVILLDNGTAIATQSVNSSGTATITTSTLAVGVHNLVAQYAGNTNNVAAQSPAFAVTIDAAVTQAALSSTNLTPTYGDTITLSAAIISSVGSIGGNVSFMDGVNVLGVSAVNASGVATLNLSSLSVGPHTIVAVYGGDTTHATSTSAGINESVTLPTQVSVTSNANPATAGLAVTFTASVTASIGSSGVTVKPTGTITFLDGSIPIGTGALNANGNATLTLSTLSVGTHAVTAAYGGDTNFRASNSTAFSQSIRTAATQTVLSSSVNPAQYSALITLTARVSGEGAVPAGTVIFNDGSNAIGQAALSNGVATLTVSTLSPGVHTLSAAYAGEPGNQASASGQVVQSVIQPTTSALVSSSNPAFTLEKPVLTATVKGVVAPIPTGPVRFLEGTRLLGTGTLDVSGNASITAAAFTAGTHFITAVYDGDSANAPVTSAPLTLTVNQRTTQTSLSATAASQATNGTLSLVAVVKGDGVPGPSGVVTFSLNGKTLGTSNIDSNGITTLNVLASAVNSGTLTASYPGDASYLPSTSAQVTLPITQATNFTLSLDPPSVTMSTGKYATTTLSIQSANGFTDSLLLGCLGLPYAATCTFEKDAVTLPANGLVKVKVIIDTGSPLTAGGEISSNTTPGKTALLAALPAGALLALLLRRRRTVPALLILLMLVMLLPAGGCGTLNQSKTPAGAYTIQVSVSGTNSAFTQSLPVSMTVTQ